MGSPDEAPSGDAATPSPDQQPPQEDDTVTPAPLDLHAPTADEPQAAGTVEAAAGPDLRCADAVELARAAASEVAGTTVGDHLAVEAEQDAGDGHVVTHSFATTDPAYVGWRWAVTVVRAEGSDDVTVDEVVLLPGEAALLAPAGCRGATGCSPVTSARRPAAPARGRPAPRAVLRRRRRRAAALRALPRARPRPSAGAVARRSGRRRRAVVRGRGRSRHPRREGRAGRCADCGFLVPLAGALGRVFGACANAMAPDDGRVVALEHGCGAHSETVVEAPESAWSGMAKEHDGFELLDTVVEPDVVVPVEDA
jgi:hypothetical protein